MIIITTTSQTIAERAQEVMAREVLYNPNLNGALFEVIAGDFDSIDGVDDAIIGAILYHVIFRAEEE